MAIKGRFPSIRPSLDLNFAKTKKLDPLITFTRASSGTYVGSDGVIKTAGINEARFDHSPTTGESLGLLVEEQRTNLLLRSEELATGPWFNANVTISNNSTDVIDPFGGTKSTKIVTAGSNGAVGQGAVISSASTGSIWLRTSSGTVSCSLIIYLSASPFTNIGTANITVTTTWQRFSVTSSTPASSASYNFQIQSTPVSTLYAFGAQLEAGAFPTSYIPTTTATATRSADVASITGNNFSSWYRQDEGTVFADLVTSSRGHNAYPRLVAILGSDVNTGNEASIYTRNISSAEDYRLFGVYWDAIGSSADFNPGSGAPLGSGRVAMAIKNNDGGYCVNGAAPLSDTSCAVPTPVQLRLFGVARFQPASSGYIRRLCYWPQRLSNAVLQVLTS